MRHATGERADALHALGTEELLLHFFAFSEIKDETHALMGVFERGGTNQNRHVQAVLANEFLFIGRAGAANGELLQSTLVGLAVLRRSERLPVDQPGGEIFLSITDDLQETVV